MAISPARLKDCRFQKGTVFSIEGDSKDMWIRDYNVRVSTHAEVLETPSISAKKVYVRLNKIDGEGNVCTYIRKNALHPNNRIGINIQTVVPVVKVFDKDGTAPYLVPVPQHLVPGFVNETITKTTIDNWAEDHLRNVDYWEFADKYLFCN